MKRFLVLTLTILSGCAFAFEQNEPAIPSDYAIDLQLAAYSRAGLMGGSSEIVGTPSNYLGDSVFKSLIEAGANQPFPWKLTLVGNNVVNASSTAGGQIYVDGGMLPLITDNKGLWAAVLSHEVSHTSRRHQVITYNRMVFNQRMIEDYRRRIDAGDKSATWALLAFRVAAPIALKKLERDQEHEADAQGMLLMARAGYHPDNVFALHHLLLLHEGERSKFAAFFSDHPRWETRDQRSNRAYLDALAEFSHVWLDAAVSPGGRPPLVAFVGHPVAKEDKITETADISIPLYCRNAFEPVDVILRFEKDNRPVQTADAQLADKEGNLAFRETVDCLDKNETVPLKISLPAAAVSGNNRSIRATVFIASESTVIDQSQPFDVHFPKTKRQKVDGEMTSHSQRSAQPVAAPAATTSTAAEANQTNSGVGIGFTATSRAIEGNGRLYGNVIASVIPAQTPSDASVPSLGLTTATRANMGAQITEVASGGVAERAYLHVGDVINAVDGRPVKTTMELAAALSNRTPGSKIRIGYMLSTGLGFFTKEVIVTPAQNR
jgi:hypothetical protein